MAKRQLNEMKPAELAKSMGLEYGGFGGWIDPKTREVKAKTVDGHLVKVEDEQDSEVERDLGRLIVVDVDDKLLYADLKKPTQTVQRYLHLLHALVQTGQDVVLMHARNSEKRLALFLKQNGMTAGPQLVPIGSGTPDKKRDFIKKKINAGYREIQFFDRDPLAIHAVESLKAPYNKLGVRVETHQIPPVSEDSRATPPSSTPNS